MSVGKLWPVHKTYRVLYICRRSAQSDRPPCLKIISFSTFQLKGLMSKSINLNFTYIWIREWANKKPFLLQKIFKKSIYYLILVLWSPICLDSWVRICWSHNTNWISELLKEFVKSKGTFQKYFSVLMGRVLEGDLKAFYQIIHLRMILNMRMTPNTFKGNNEILLPVLCFIHL